MMRATILLVLVAACACTGLSRRVDRSLLEQVPNEEKLILFDAENGVLIARDEYDVAERARKDAVAALDRARRYRDVIAERRSSGESIDTPDVLQLLEQWNEARIDVRAREVELAEVQRSTADVRLWAARARYERAKAKLVKDFAPEEGNDVQLADFDAQVAEWDGREKEADALVEERRAAVREARAAYDALAAQLSALSKGAYGGPWADLLE
jgi:hypothetical protein